MTPSLPPTEIEDEPNTTSLLTAELDEDYNSADDEDFDPDAAVPPPPDSGDEQATPRKKRKRRSLSSASSDAGLDADDSGGEGGLIKTRAQRAKETAERPSLGGVLAADTTTDVDELWRQMNAKPEKPKSPPASESANTPVVEAEKVNETTEPKPGDEEMITISRTYTFAGKVISETKTVPKSSQEAQAYLSTLDTAKNPSKPPSDPSLPARRPPPKKRASAFDSAAAARKPIPAPKLNTLEKSRLDWAGFVDKEGIGDELKKHTASDKSFLDRQAFLGRVDEKRERAWKEGQKKK
jgi:Bucentaur or craniofacial development